MKAQDMRDRDMREENRGGERANIQGEGVYVSIATAAKACQGTVGLPH